MANGVRKWIAGARPKTLPAAVVPVAVGYAFVVSRRDESLDSITNVALALVVSVALQVGVNYANDYSDGIKGTDAKRVGPVRLVGSALAAAKSVKRAAYLSFLIAAIAGLGIAATTSWWLIAVGVAAIVAAWTYTGGPSPYGYLGFGELFVFVFFGVVATAGTTYAVSEQVRTIEVVGSCVVGLLAVAILVVNNLRDIPTDSLAGKKTLAVRLGDSWTRRLYVGIVVASAIGVALVARTHTWAIVALVGYAFAVEPAKRVVRGARGAELIPVLGATARVQLVVGLLLAFGLVAS